MAPIRDMRIMRGSGFLTSDKATSNQLRKALMDTLGFCFIAESVIASLALVDYRQNCSLNFLVKSENRSTNLGGSFVNHNDAALSK